MRLSLDSPIVYAAIDLDTALGSALKKLQSELREMEARKRELQELSQQQRPLIDPCRRNGLSPLLYT